MELIFLIVILGLIWAFVFLPSRRRQQSHRAMQDAVVVGDEIITAGGLHARVLELGDDTLRVEIAPGVVSTLDRRAVAAVATEIEVEVDRDDDPSADPQQELRTPENGGNEAAPR